MKKTSYAHKNNTIIKKPSPLLLFFLMALIAAALTASKANAAEFTFTSKLDRFTVDVSDGAATYKGQEVSAEPFTQIKPLFDAQLEDACDSGMGHPDLTIARKAGEKEEKRLIFIEKKMVSDGKNCGNINGYGLYRLPLHHNWFEEKKSVTIALNNSFSIWKNDRLVVEFVKTDRGWRNKDADFFTNWLFFEKFLEVLKSFPIDFRAHPLAAKAFTNFELRQDQRVFKFVKVGETTWAVQFPEMPWLAASGQFGLFDDMDQKIWISPFAKNLKIVKDKTAKPDLRMKAVRSLSDTWGPDVKYVLQDVMLTAGDNSEVKKDIANLMKSRPTDENFKILIDSLKTTDDAGLLYTITKILRLRNPKGPTIQDDDEGEVITQKIAEWTKWRQTLK